MAVDCRPIAGTEYDDSDKVFCPRGRPITVSPAVSRKPVVDGTWIRAFHLAI